ncbi:probable nuclear envelope integral membrane protein 1 [Coccomyxa sp. Obi]|nr:probable nuclear envelope integral membrane protein 1 [Coccomyxa sp. Obi]
MGVIALVISCLCILSAEAATQTKLARDLRLSDGTYAVYTVVEGVPNWRLLPYLWVDKAVNLRWNRGKDLRTYVAPDLEQLQRRIDNKESVWCGWDRFFGASDTECVTRISPFGQTLVAVADSKGTQRLQSGFVCTATVEEKVSYVQLAQGVLGAALYWWAGPLSHSMFFRLSAGSLGFMMLSVLILIFVLSRAVPNKRGMGAACAVLGSTFTGLVRYWFGRWIPTFEQLMYSKVALAYLGASGLVGLAVTYYYDSDTNTKLQNILKYGLKLLGLALTATSTSMPEASIALACCLLALDVAMHARGFRRAGRNVMGAGRDAGQLADAALQKVGEHLGLGSPCSPKRTAVAPSPHVQQRVAAAPAASESPPSTTGSSQDLDAAASMPLPGDREARPQQNGAYTQTPKAQMQRSWQEDANGVESPLVQRGLIFNERTGKTIKIGAATYNRLVLEGFTPDRIKGVLTPPAAAARGTPKFAGSAGGKEPLERASPRSPRSRSMRQLQ